MLVKMGRLFKNNYQIIQGYLLEKLQFEMEFQLAMTIFLSVKKMSLDVDQQRIYPTIEETQIKQVNPQKKVF